MNGDELTPSEKKSIESLPRERIPDRRLEKRTVRALRKRGMLGARSGIGITISPAWAAVAAAAMIALAAGGFALGQWVGARQTANAMLAMHEKDNLRLAAEVQRAGTAYVTALNALAANLDAQEPDTKAQGRQVALAALYAAAERVVSIAPDDPVAQSILWTMDRSTGLEADSETRAATHYVWF